MKTTLNIDDTVMQRLREEAAQGSVLERNCSAADATGLYENLAVYVFEDPDGTVEPDDIDITDETDVDPVTTATVGWNETDQVYEYEVGFLLAPASYRVALTCTADVDDREADDYTAESAEPQNFAFIADQAVEVEVNSTTEASFQANSGAV